MRASKGDMMEYKRKYDRYDMGYRAGQKEVLMEIARIIKENEYPEYLESDLVDYMRKRGFNV